MRCSWTLGFSMIFLFQRKQKFSLYCIFSTHTSLGFERKVAQISSSYSNFNCFSPTIKILPESLTSKLGSLLPTSSLFFVHYTLLVVLIIFSSTFRFLVSYYIIYDHFTYILNSCKMVIYIFLLESRLSFCHCYSFYFLIRK